MIEIGGFVPLTTIDYPNHLAAVVFCKGCMWSCRYCHNHHLRNCDHARTENSLSWNRIIEVISARKIFLDAVVFSGGEPLLQRNIHAALSKVKDLGLLVGLHTSGAFPLRLKRIIHLLDWVGLDIKAPFVGEKYELITGRKQASKPVQQSLQLLAEYMPGQFQTRTTFDETVLDADDKAFILRDLRQNGVLEANHVWQKCRV